LVKYFTRPNTTEQALIDYLQIIRPEKESIRNDRRLQVIETIELLTEKAKRTPAAWIIAAQTNRGSHQAAKKSDSAPDHSSFQESAAIEQNAGLAMTLHRPENEYNKLKINISKNRFGKLTEAELSIDPVSGAIIGQEIIRTTDQIEELYK